MVINSTSAVDVSIQAVSPELKTGAAASVAASWAIAPVTPVNINAVAAVIVFNLDIAPLPVSVCIANRRTRPAAKNVAIAVPVLGALHNPRLVTHHSGPAAPGCLKMRQYAIDQRMSLSGLALIR